MIISVIVPVFNAEKYLDRCLKSVVNATKNLDSEILLIDNGSTDNSLSIMQNYAKKYPSVSILKCDTPGAAAARNYGVKKATGKYVWFVDADDMVAEVSVKELVEMAEREKADLVMMGMERHYSDGHADYLSAVNPAEPDYKSRFVRYGMGPVQVLIKRTWWEKNKFAFREGIIHEDMELMSALILYTDKFASINKPLYHYYQNPDSVLHKLKWDPHYFDIFVALEGVYGRFKKAQADKTYHDELEWFFIWNLLIDSAGDFGKFKEGRSGFKRSRKMMKKYFPNWRRNRFLRQKPWKLRLKVRLNYCL